MSKRSVTTLIFCVAAAILASRGLAAQSISVRGVRGLTFGTVVPGVPAVVLRTDAVKSGQFEIQGPFIAFLRLTFTLPTVLNGPAGATMPISFSTSDAGYSYNNTIGNQNDFNPNQSFQALMLGGRSGVWLGGRVSPTAGQRAGSYTGSAVLLVVIL